MRASKTTQLICRSLIGQYGAALKMLDGALRSCPPELWNKKVGKHPFWHVAYHVLFYTDLYLSRAEAEFRPIEAHQPESQVMGRMPWPPYKTVVVKKPYDKPTLRQYVSTVAKKAEREVSCETASTFAGESGFVWIPFPRFELHLYNLRHIQHHTGQLCAFLRARNGRGVGWVATRGAGE